MFTNSEVKPANKKLKPGTASLLYEQSGDLKKWKVIAYSDDRSQINFLAEVVLALVPVTILILTSVYLKESYAFQKQTLLKSLMAELPVVLFASTAILFFTLLGFLAFKLKWLRKKDPGYSTLILSKDHIRVYGDGVFGPSILIMLDELTQLVVLESAKDSVDLEFTSDLQKNSPVMVARGPQLNSVLMFSKCYDSLVELGRQLTAQIEKSRHQFECLQIKNKEKPDLQPVAVKLFYQEPNVTIQPPDSEFQKIENGNATTYVWQSPDRKLMITNSVWLFLMAFGLFAVSGRLWMTSQELEVFWLFPFILAIVTFAGALWSVGLYGEVLKFQIRPQGLTIFHSILFRKEIRQLPLNSGYRIFVQRDYLASSGDLSNRVPIAMTYRLVIMVGGEQLNYCGGSNRRDLLWLANQLSDHGTTVS
ncbi:MAG: hypothetical protein AAF939_20350 [Planctomycetota bacterium]